MTIEPHIEMLARMWVACDPNRQHADPDELITMHDPKRTVPRWHWFIPRAEASAAFIDGCRWNLSPRPLTIKGKGEFA